MSPALTLHAPAAAGRRLPEIDELKGLAILMVVISLIREYCYYYPGRFFNGPVPTPARIIPAMIAGLAITLFLSVQLHRLFDAIPAKRQRSFAP
jgi:hypothetical protein